MKTQILETLGEQGLGLPSQVEAGLAANDRLKYYFSLLQVSAVMLTTLIRPRHHSGKSASSPGLLIVPRIKRLQPPARKERRTDCPDAASFWPRS